jgi:hypothetical protein
MKDTMSIIKGIDHLSSILSTEQMEQLESVADIHQKQSNIEFTILSVEEDTINIEAEQSQTRSGKYATEASLQKKSREVFDKPLAGFTLNIMASPFLASPTSVVNPLWLDNKMKQKGVRIKQIAFETGVDRESIAEWVTGKRAMSQIVKAMFYFYLSK